MTDKELRVLGAIRLSGNNFIGAAVLADLCGMDEREVRRTVKLLVEKHNQPIIARPGEGGGYKLVTDPEELRNYKLRLMAQAFTVLRRARCFDRSGTLKRLCGQLELALPPDLARQTELGGGGG